MVDKEKLQGKAEQLVGKVEQVVGKATKSNDVLIRGHIDEAKGRARETVADFKHSVNRQAGEVQKDVAMAEDKARGMLAGLYVSPVAMWAAFAVLLIAVGGVLFRSKLSEVDFTALKQKGAEALDAGVSTAARVKTKAEMLENRLATQVSDMSEQLSSKRTMPGYQSMTTLTAPLISMIGVVAVVASLLMVGRRAI